MPPRKKAVKTPAAKKKAIAKKTTSKKKTTKKKKVGFFKRNWRSIPKPVKIAGIAFLAFPLTLMATPIIIGGAITGGVVGVRGMLKAADSVKMRKWLSKNKKPMKKGTIKHKTIKRRLAIGGGTAGAVVGIGAGAITAVALPWIAAGTVVVTAVGWGFKNRKAIFEVKESGEWRAILKRSPEGQKVRRKLKLSQKPKNN